MTVATTKQALDTWAKTADKRLEAALISLRRLQAGIRKDSEEGRWLNTVEVNVDAVWQDIREFQLES